MGCSIIQSTNEPARKKINLETDIPEKPVIPNVDCANVLFDYLWTLKDKWLLARKPMSGVYSTLQKSAEFEDGDLTSIVKGLIACICQDMKPGEEDFDKLIEVNLKSPFIHFKTDQPIVKKYSGLIKALEDTVVKYQEAIEQIVELIKELGEFQNKLKEAAKAAFSLISGLDMQQRIEASRALSEALKNSKKCASLLLQDLNNVKNEFADLKTCATETTNLIKDTETLKEIGGQCREAKANTVKECFVILKAQQKLKKGNKKQSIASNKGDISSDKEKGKADAVASFFRKMICCSTVSDK